MEVLFIEVTFDYIDTKEYVLYFEFPFEQVRWWGGHIKNIHSWHYRGDALCDNYGHSLVRIHGDV